MSSSVIRHRIFDYVRDSYGVPAHRGARVWFRGIEGRIVHATHYVFVRFAIADVRGTSMECWVPRSRKPWTHFTVVLHPCEETIAYDRETPIKYRPKGVGYFVWSEVCHQHGVNIFTPESRTIQRELMRACA